MSRWAGDQAIAAGWSSAAARRVTGATQETSARTFLARIGSTTPASHLFKYRLAYVVGGECVLRDDNERGKGDHRHAGSAETVYAFTTPDQLMADFEADVMRWNREHGRA